MMLPCAPEAELGMLACIVLDPDKIMERAATAGVTDDWFFTGMHRLVWAELRERYHAAKPVNDGILLIQHFREKKLDDGSTLLEKIGGERFVEELFAYTPGTGLFSRYLEVCEEKVRKRQVIAAARRMLDDGTNDDVPWKQAVENAEAALFSLRENHSRKGTRHVAEIAFEAADHFMVLRKQRGRVTGGIPTGFPDIDRTLQGMRAGQLFVIAARPAMGKTSLAVTFAEGCAVDAAANNVPTGFYSLEMSDRELMERMILGRAGVDFGKARTGFFGDADFVQMQQEIVTLAGSKLFLFDGYEVTIADLRAQIRRDVARHGIRIAFIDYLQIIEGSSKEAKREIRLRIIECCKGLKGLAKELQIPIVVLAQAGRGAEDNPGKEPALKDLQESSAIEQYGDLVAFIHRPSYYKAWAALGEKQQEDWCGQAGALEKAGGRSLSGECLYEMHAQFLIRKNRHGPVGNIPILFDGARARFAPRTVKLYSGRLEERQGGFD